MDFSKFNIDSKNGNDTIIKGLEKGDDKFLKSIPKEVGILPLQKLTIFPFQIAPLIIMNEKSIKLIDKVMIHNRIICVITQKKDSSTYSSDNLYKFGCVCKILRMVKLPNNHIRILVQGIARAKVIQYLSDEPYIKASIDIKDDIIKADKELNALKRNVITGFQKIASFIPQIGEELQIIVMNIQDVNKLADMIATNINITTEERQELLEILRVKKRLEKILIYLNREQEVLELGTKIQSKIKSGIDKKQKE